MQMHEKDIKHSVRAGQQENGERESIFCNNAVFTWIQMNIQNPHNLTIYYICVFISIFRLAQQPRVQ